MVIKGKIKQNLPIILGFGMIALVSISNIYFAIIGLIAVVVYLLEKNVKGWKTDYYLFIFFANIVVNVITSTLKLTHGVINDVVNIAGITSLIIFIVKKISRKFYPSL